jgi:3-hydroxyisobutyrate dehydrogenase-like beta-hydroxyacid dehydrogenase
VAQRGEQTARRCREGGIKVLDSLAEVVRASGVILSVVPPGAAASVADAYCGLAQLAPAQSLYVDANSIGPDLARGLADRIERHGRGFVDAAINGLASRLTSGGGTLFLSGSRADEVAALFVGQVRTRVLGAQPGQASAMKMLLSGLSKGLCALYAELGVLAERQGMVSQLLEESAQIYPGLTAVVERMLPTYARHAARRATEMSELEQTARSAGLEPQVIAAVRHVHERLAAGTPRPGANGRHDGLSVLSIINQLAAEGFLGRAKGV